MPIDPNLLIGQPQQQPQQQGQGGINFGLLNPQQQQPKQGVLAVLQPPQAPQSYGGDGGIGELLGGLKSLIGGLTGKGSNPSNPAQPNPNPAPGQSPNTTVNPGYNPQSPQQTISQDLNKLYQRPAFQTALQAQQQSFKSGITKSPIMTVVDYSLPANQPRMWVVDTQQNKILMNTYVAQGATPGFSNNPGSHQSSLGTFLTGDTYHSDSMNRDALRIQGLEKGINDNAFARGIVVHGGNYIGPDKNGTSWGCFAVPNGDAPKLIGLTKGGTIIHAYAPDAKSMQSFGEQLTPAGKISFGRQLTSLEQNARPRYPDFRKENDGINVPPHLYPLGPNNLDHIQNIPNYNPNHPGHMQNLPLDPNNRGHMQLLNNGSNNMSSPLTINTIKQFEGMENFKDGLSHARWDVNAYRVGHGSDTYTTADGKVHRVTAGTTITQEDADRDLARRAQEFETTATHQVGVDNWNQLSPSAQAALTSVAYNYGSLPKSVVAAVKTGSPSVIAGAVRALGGANNGVNRQRRNQEASMIVNPIGPETMNSRSLPGTGQVPIRNLRPEDIDAIMRSQGAYNNNNQQIG